MNTRIALVACLCLGLVSVAAAADKVDLKLKYLPGTYTVTMDMDLKTTATVGEKEQPGQSMKMTMVIKMVVTPGEGGKKNIDLKFDKVKLTMNMPGGEQTYDSTGPADKQPEMLAKLYDPILKAKLTMVMDETGKIVETKGWEEMAKNMGPAGAGMGAAFSDKAMKQMIEQQQAIMPTKPVGVGDGYESKMTLPMPILGNMDIKFDMKVKAIDGTGDDQVATLEFKAVAGTDKPTTTQMGPAKMTLDSMKMTQQGELKFNVKLGSAMSGTVDQDMNMAMTVPGEDGNDVKTTVKQTGKIKTSTVFEPAK